MSSPWMSVVLKGILLSFAVLFIVKFLIVAGGHLFYPVLVREIPVDGFFQAFLELERGFPAQFLVELCRIDGIAEVMAGAVFYVGDEFCGLARGAAELPVHDAAEQ